MIVHELVVNCFKHAFRDGRKGRVTVKCRREAGSVVSVVVQDNGVGMPERAPGGAGNGLGWTLIDALAKQLDGTLLVERGAGTRVELRFSDESPVHRPVHPPASAREATLAAASLNGVSLSAAATNANAGRGAVS
jgi:two-component sensor histidine kinase